FPARFVNRGRGLALERAALRSAEPRHAGRRAATDVPTEIQQERSRRTSTQLSTASLIANSIGPLGKPVRTASRLATHGPDGRPWGVLPAHAMKAVAP